MKNAYWITIIFFISLCFSACRKESEKVKPKIVALTESVYSSVIIEPDSFYKVYAATRGIVDEVMIQEGDLIQKGEVIARIVNDNSKLASEDAEMEMILAKQNFEGNSNLIQDLKNELSIAQLTAENDSINFKRQQRLWQQKIGSHSDFEKRQLTYQSSLNKVSTLKAQLVRKQDELNTVLQKSKNNYAIKLNQQADFIVQSRINGKVYELLKEEGESISDQEPIAFIGSNDKFIIKMQVDEVDIVRIKKDQLIYITLDAYKDQVFQATVKKIIPKMNEETQTFWVEGTFKELPSVLYSGLRGEANIVIAEKVNALTIPLEYLSANNTVKTETEIVTVTTGLRSLEQVEILSGLDSSTVILKHEAE